MPPKNQREPNICYNWFYLCTDDGRSAAGLPSLNNREEMVRDSEKIVVHLSNKNKKIREYFMDESLFRNHYPGENDEIIILAKGWRGQEWNLNRRDEMIDTCMDHAKKSEIIGLNQNVSRLLGCTVIVRRGYRGYGYYQCEECHQNWTSAYSFKNFKQSCKNCEIMMFAYKRHVRNGEAVKKEGQGRHLQENCERCIKGLKCTALISERSNYQKQPKAQTGLKCTALSSERNNYQKQPKAQTAYKKYVQAPAKPTSYSNAQMTATSKTITSVSNPHDSDDNRNNQDDPGIPYVLIGIISIVAIFLSRL